MPKVSVHIPCYNSEKYILETIRSVLGQTFSDFEIIVINDGSIDGTEKLIKSFRDDRIKYFHQDNKGLAVTRNRALSLSTGEYIAFLDHDDIWLPTKLEKQINALDAAPEAALAYSNFYRLFPDGKKILAFRKRQPAGDAFEALLAEYVICLSTAVIRKKAIDDLGIIFDEKFDLFEEYDLFMRLLHKHEAVYTEEPLAIYLIYDTRTTMLFRNNYADEFEYAVKKLMGLDPLLTIKYSKALKRLNGTIGHVRAKIAMEGHDSKNARRHLRPHIWSGNKFCLLYLLTFLPESIWNKAHNIKNRGILL